MNETERLSIAAYFFTQSEENSPSYKVFKPMFQKEGKILDIAEMSKAGGEIVKENPPKYRSLITMLSKFANNENNVFNRSVFGMRKDLEMA